MNDKQTLESQILDFFKNNPDEELTYEDAHIKFGRSFKQTEDVMRSLGHEKRLAWRMDQMGKVRQKVFMRADCSKH